jgi:mRNA-degrading endonuclease toxin of MazEF toxin-antitoxin module
VDFGYDGKLRSALVVFNPDPNRRIAVASVVQITTQFAGTPYEVTLPRVPWLRE